MASREEKRVIEALIDVCRGQSVTMVVQVGAGDGWESYQIHKALGCSATAIEGRMGQDPCSGELSFRHAIIGSTDGDTRWFEEGDLSGQLARGGAEVSHEGRKQERLDTFCERLGIKPDALIIDTEGTTLEVLAGCGDLLDGVNVIYAECQSSPLRVGGHSFSEVEKMLEQRGFSKYENLPTYYAGQAQFNMTWIRK